MATSTIMRDYLVRYQQTAVRETGRRPVAFLRQPMDESLLLPGCPIAGYAFWQPVPWENGAPLGKDAYHFHQSILDYVSLCQFLEVRFILPVAKSGSPLSFLHHRVFETCRNTQLSPPSRAFEEALKMRRPDVPLSFCMAQTADDGEPLLLMVRADDGQIWIQRPASGEKPLNLRLDLDRLLPKLQFVFDR